MNKERLTQLLNSELDGESTAAEKAEWQELLEQSAEARALKAEYQQLFNLLDAVPAEQVPEGLADHITGQIQLPNESRPSWLSRLFQGVQPMPVAVSFLFGVVVTSMVLGTSRESIQSSEGASPTVGNLVGTMMAGQSQEEVTDHGSMAVNASGLTGTISLHESGEVYVLNFELKSDERVEVAVGLTGAGLSFGGVARSNNGSDMAENLEIAGGTLRVVNQGEQSLTVFLHPLANAEVNGRNLQIDILPGTDSGEV